VVHLAAHGEHHLQNPLFSSLRVGDGPVFAHEMEGQALRATHVVLSACDAGRVSVRRGEEPLGLTASLLALGVPTVVAAGSPVPDAVAHPVMSDYHRHLAEGLDAATALARATEHADLLGASFTCYGSGWRAGV
jgi:CHAT domain-containing protein